MFVAPCCRATTNLSLLVLAWSNRCVEEWKCIQAGGADCASHLRICRFYRSACLSEKTAEGEGGSDSRGGMQGLAPELAQHMLPVLAASAGTAVRGVAALRAAAVGGDPPPWHDFADG